MSSSNESYMYILSCCVCRIIFYQHYIYTPAIYDMAGVIFLKIVIYGESWDSSCEKSWVPGQNRWVPIQKHESLGLYVTTQLI